MSGVSALPVFFTGSLPELFSRTSQAQPEPNCVAPAVENSFLKLSSEPKSRSRAAASGPEGSAVFFFSKLAVFFFEVLRVSFPSPRLSLGSLSLSPPLSPPPSYYNHSLLVGRHRVPEERVVPHLRRVVERRRRLAAGPRRLDDLRDVRDGVELGVLDLAVEVVDVGAVVLVPVELHVVLLLCFGLGGGSGGEAEEEEEVMMKEVEEEEKRKHSLSFFFSFPLFFSASFLFSTLASLEALPWRSWARARPVEECICGARKREERETTGELFSKNNVDVAV